MSLSDARLKLGWAENANPTDAARYLREALKHIIDHLDPDDTPDQPKPPNPQPLP